MIESRKNKKYECLLTATGRTTLLVDDAVQRLFAHMGEWVRVKDHAHSMVGSKATKDLMHRIQKRMLSEHNIILEYEFDNCSLRIPCETAQALKRFREQKVKEAEILDRRDRGI